MDTDTDILKQILDKLCDIDKRLQNVENELIYIKTSSDKMDEHISFVENVYDSVKSPFYYIMNKVKPIASIPSKEVKSITEGN